MMSDSEFKAFLTLLMSADPSPLSEPEDKILRDFADREARSRDYTDWIDAFHRLGSGA